MFKKSTVLLLLLMGSSLVFADGAKDMATIKGALKSILPNGVDSIAESIVPGLYEVMDGAQIYYVSADGNYLLQGDMFDIKSRTNLTDDRRSIGRKKIVDTMSESDLIVYKPEKTKYHITVFTDVDCGYCRKLHREMDAYLKEGIEVRYAAFPRSGPNTPSWNKAVAVWCDKDQQDAMTRAKNGSKLVPPSPPCKNPVMDQYNAGRNLGVTGTPSLVFKSGKMVPGYVPAERLKQILEDSL